MVALRARGNTFEAKVRVPKQLVARVGKEWLYLHISAGDRRAAQHEAEIWEAGLRAEWAVHLNRDTPAIAAFREVYRQTFEQATGGDLLVHGGPEDDPALLGVQFELEEIADEIGNRPLAPLEKARVVALQDASRALQNLSVPRRTELEPIFSELAGEYLRWWKAQHGLKQTNTEQQKRATFDLFSGFWGERPIRHVRKADAARFFDALRLMDPSWARSARAKELTWEQLQRKFGGREKGLSDATLNRHAATLKALWTWAEERDHCEGHNPFSGFRKRLREGVNVQGYRAWETDELNRLFCPPPRRADLTEVMLVGLFTGMRLDEIASLRGEQLREEEGIRFIQVVDAKTPAGNRQVPLHSALGWLWSRAERAGSGRIWPTFNPEGPGKKAGADAGREFSRFKQSRGFSDRQKAFHSFRKNVTRIMERARVPENEWAQVFGHEKGFTYGRYNADGITLSQKAAIIGLISYPELKLPKVR